MEIWLSAGIGVLAFVIAALLLKIHFLHKAAGEIGEGFAERLAEDTNTLIGISSGDRRMRKLADTVNAELRTLRDKRRRYEQGDRELKEAVTNISHDLRTPLTAILGHLELLEKEEVSGDVLRHIEVIQNRAALMKQLTEELFCYSVIYGKEHGLVLAPVVVNRILEESLAAYYEAFRGRGIVPDIRLPETPIVRLADPSALSRVFSNLLHNAVKYSDGDLSVALAKTGEIAFSNTASGLDEVRVGRLFDRFYTVEAAEKSTGLGLSIARILVKQMNGTITAEYENGRLCIRMELPEGPRQLSSSSSEDME